VIGHYHGGHRRPFDGVASRREWFGTLGLVAFTHDLLTDGPLPADYEHADVLVSDLPWRVGFDTFNQRAGITDDRTYGECMAAVAELVEGTAVPVYLVTGKHALAYLPEPATTLPMMLNQDEAIAICYRPGDEADGRYRNTWEFLDALARRYGTAGDPCCGYGRTARVFLQAGRSAVVSDMNPLCIGYIAEHAGGWLP
jgi:hypothetical protein